MNKTCPNCGYCPHCGRSHQAAPIPFYPQPWYPSPFWQIPQGPWLVPFVQTDEPYRGTTTMAVGSTSGPLCGTTTTFKANENITYTVQS